MHVYDFKEKCNQIVLSATEQQREENPPAIVPQISTIHYEFDYTSQF